jgi:N-acetylmuramoyl-L-alanine amidase
MSCDHTVQRGEYLTKIAKNYGFRDWRTIYDHPRNAEFREKRPNPNVIKAGDILYIPDKNTKTETVATGRKHIFQLKGDILMLKLILKDHDDRPLANEPYTITIGDQEVPGETSDDGLLEHPIPHGIETAEIILKRQKLGWTLHIGDLDPVLDHDTQKLVIEGIQQRLNNLGFPCGKADGILGPKTRRAVRLFQSRILHRKDADGALDAATVDSLKSDHKS